MVEEDINEQISEEREEKDNMYEYQITENYSLVSYVMTSFMPLRQKIKELYH